MKKFIYFLVFFLVSFVANSQTQPSSIPSPRSDSGFAQYNWVRALKGGFIFPERDTAFTPTYIGTVVFWRNAGVDSSLWVYAKTTGRRWSKVVTLSGGVSSGTVTSIATNAATGIAGGTITTSGTLFLDTTLVSTRARLKQGLDSLAATKVSSVGLTMPSAFNVANSPITTSGTIAVTAAGNASQYIRGDGVLANLPTSGEGGGASVSYYLNGSVNQGTIGGVTYYEMNKTPIIGAGTDFTTSSNGYIASFLTDANDPALLVIPAGNWNFETYFEASSGGGTPTFYIELYKYDGTTFTLIASNSTSPKSINDGTNIEAYFSALAVPQTTLTLTDRLAIRIYVNTSGRTITLHTENNTLCQVVTTFTTGLTALNGLTAQVQYFATSTSGSDFNISSATDTHTFNLPTASATNRGALSSANWTTFNNKIGPSDTASMLLPYLRKTDTATMLSPYYRTATANAALATKLNISDTTAMLLGYTRVQRFTDSLTNVQARIQTKQPIGNYLTFADSTTILAGRWLPNRSADSIAVIRALANSKGVGTVTSVAASAGTGISVSGSPITSSGTLTITNTAPDQTVTLTGGTGISVSGTYPNFTVTNSSPSSGGTVTSVGLSAPTGFSVSGTPVTSSGTLALTFASGYNLPTTASQSLWDVAYSKRLSSASLTSSQLTLTLGDASTVTASVPTFNQNTTGTAASLSAVLSSTLGGAGSVSGILKANGSGVVSAAVAGTDYVIPSALSGYLPLSGGTLTGALNGTSAAFSGATQLATSSGRVLIKTTTDNGQDAFQVAGSGLFTGTLTSGLNVTVNGSGAGYYQAATILKSGTANNPELRALGTYMFNEGTDKTWFSGNPYNDADRFIIGRITGTTFNEQAADPAAASVYLSIASTGAATFSSSVTASSFIRSGGSSNELLAANGSVVTAGTNITIIGGVISAIGSGSGTVTSIGTNNGSGITGGTITSSGTLAIDTSIISTRANVTALLLAKQNNITVTTTGTSGAATLVGSTLNIPNYTPDLSGYLQLSGGTLTGALNGTSAAFSSTVTVSNGGSVYSTPQESLNILNRAYFVDAKYQYLKLGMRSDRAVFEADWYSGAGGAAPSIAFLTGNIDRLVINGSTGAATFSSSVTASSFIRSGGTSSQFLKADGSVDANTYLTSAGAVTSIAGTTNQITVSASTGAVTVSLPSAVTITGAMTATGFFESSDSRLKTLIYDNYNVSGIDMITPKLYQKNGKTELGYYAQDLVGVLDSAVTEGKDGMLRLSYREVLVAKVYALEQEVKKLKAKIK